VAAALGPEDGPLAAAAAAAAAGAPGVRHLAACRRACLALKLHNALAPRLQVCGSVLVTAPGVTEQGLC
jgi:hypothetical protein